MFSSIGWGEILLLAAVGLVVFGPDRLPKAAADAGRMIRQLRAMAQGAASELKAELGPEMADLDLRSLHPRELLSQSLLDDEDASSAAVGRYPSYQPLGPAERPPFDSDAT